MKSEKKQYRTLISYLNIKIYMYSKRAILLWMMGNLLTIMFVLTLLFLIGVAMFGSDPEVGTVTGSYIRDIITFSFLSAIMYFGAKQLYSVAEYTADIAAVKKIRKSFEFTKKMARRRPDLKEWLMSQNEEYYDYIISKKDMYEEVIEQTSVGTEVRWKGIAAITLIVIFCVIAYFF